MAKNKSSAVRWIISNSKRILPLVALLTAMGVAGSYISVRFAVASMHLLDSATGKSNLSFSYCILTIVALLVIQLVLEIAYTLLDVMVRVKYKNFMQRGLFKTILTRSFSSLGDFHSGELINRLTSDIEIVNTNVIGIIPTAVSLVTGVVFSFAAMARLDLTLSLICLALGPVVLFAASVYGRRMKGLYKKCRRNDGKIRSFMQECIQNIIAVKAFCGENKSSQIAKKLQNENYRLNMKRGYLSVIVNILYYLAMYSAYYFAVAWCAYKIKIGVMTVGAFTAIVQLVGSVQSPFKELAGIIPKFYETCASAERISELEGLASDFDSETENVNAEKSAFESLTAENLTFSYDGKVILDGAQMSADKGETVVIQGISGGGKSTFFKIILGILKPDKGCVKVKINGKSEKVGAKTRPLFAYVPQGNMLLTGTVRDNIAFFEDACDDAKIERCAKAACIWDYICSLPGGLDSTVGENGLGLSEGQVQRIAIARALYTDAPVLLLDEATSALDEHTELKILESVKKMRGKTCIIITHRPGALDICDKSITLLNGKFVYKEK